MAWPACWSWGHACLQQCGMLLCTCVCRPKGLLVRSYQDTAAMLNVCLVLCVCMLSRFAALQDILDHGSTAKDASGNAILADVGLWMRDEFKKYFKAKGPGVRQTLAATYSTADSCAPVWLLQCKNDVRTKSSNSTCKSRQHVHGKVNCNLAGMPGRVHRCNCAQVNVEICIYGCSVS